jgi:hypothetical protein
MPSFCLLKFKVSDEKSVISLTEDHVCVRSCLFVDPFMILCLCLSVSVTCLTVDVFGESYLV